MSIQQLQLILRTACVGIEIGGKRCCNQLSKISIFFSVLPYYALAAAHENPAHYWCDSSLYCDSTAGLAVTAAP
jgi:hypothetical protein